MNTPAVRVLLVDDSPLDLVVLRRLIGPMRGVEVVATASNGAEALRLLQQLQPDVVCTGILMPKMDGMELTRRIMALRPTAILAASSSVEPWLLPQPSPLQTTPALSREQNP